MAAKNKALRVILLQVSLFFVGCATLSNDRAIDDSIVSDINQELSEAMAIAKAQEEQGKVAPQSVMSALMPEVNTSRNEEYLDRKFDVQVSKIDANLFFRSLVKDTAYNVAMHPDVKGRLSLDLANVTVPEVMDIATSVYGYSIRRRGTLFTVYPAGLRTEIFKINYVDVVRKGSSETRVSSGNVSDADSDNNSSSSNSTNNSGSDSDRLVSTRITTENDSDFWSNLRLTLEALVGSNNGRKIVVTPQSGMIVVKAMPQELETVREYLQSAELIMQRQVVLEAKILEVSLSDGFQAGINWAALGEPGSGKTVLAAQGSSALSPLTSDNVFSRPATSPGSVLNVADNTLNGFFGLSLNLNDFNAIIDLLETQGTVQVLSSPRIATVNNQKALIKVGQDQFFVTEVENSVTRDVGGTVNTPSVEFTPFFSGIALDVTPQISGNDNIVLHVHPTVSEVVEQERVFQINGESFNIPLAKSSIRESDSIIFAKSDQVVVIGGLIQNASNDNNANVPWISKVPGLGALFRQRSHSTVKSELVILLKPKVVDPATIVNDVMNSARRIEGMQSLMK